MRLVDAAGTAGKNDAFGVQPFYFSSSRTAGKKLRICIDFSDAPGDELRVLGAEVKDGYAVSKRPIRQRFCGVLLYFRLSHGEPPLQGSYIIALPGLPSAL